MKGFLIVFTLLIGGFIKAQTVNIYLVTPALASVASVEAYYVPLFGAGNVTTTTGGTLANYSNYDIVIFNWLGAGYTGADVTALVSFIQSGGHVILSSEGATAGGAGFMSSVWNAVTGQNITETGAGANGTGSPPRFHNSIGPWHSSPDPTLTGSTTSYASFANLNPLNVTHQRNLTPPTCGNIEGLCAVYPSRPNLGDGTLYIQGEIQFPFFNGSNSAAVTAHGSAIAKMHHTLLTNNQTELDILNTWEANLVVDDDFIGNDTLICTNDFVPFTKICPQYASYSWEDINGNVLATTQSFDIQDSGVYIIKTTGIFPQCDGIDTLKVEFKPSPNARFKVDTVCQGNATTFTNQSTISAPATMTYFWDFDDGNTATTASPAHTYSTANQYNVTLTATSDLGCTDDTTVQAVVYASPTADFSVVDDCLYNNPDITESSTVSQGSITSWEWNFGDVLPATVIQSTDQNPVHTYTNADTYNITLTVTTENGCKDDVTKSTTRYPVPNVSFTSVPACEGDAVSFTNTTTIDAPDNITSWVWNYGDGAPMSSVLEETHIYNQSGFYNVTLIASSNNGCVGDATTFVHVYALPVAEFSATTTCENGNPTSFINLSTVSEGSIVSYEWDFDDNGSTSNNQFAFYDYNTSGTYNVSLKVTTDNGCEDIVNHDVVVLPKPDADFTSNITEGCNTLCVDFSDNSQPNAASLTNYFWIFGNGVVDVANAPSVCFDNISHTDNIEYDVTLIVTNNEGCKDTIVKPSYITVWPEPLADFELDPEETDMYNSNIVFTNLSEGGDTYSWDYGDGEQGQIFEEEHLYADTGSYTVQLVVLTDMQCSDTVEKNVKITPVLNVYIPSAFTPDGDGINDVFFVEGFAIDEEHFSFEIFDRWGTLVYFTDKFIPWDGTYKGKKAPQDTYVYQVRLREKGGNKEYKYRGHVSLLR